MSENITTITQSAGNDGKKYKSSQSLHELGLDNYPNPEWPEGPRLNRYSFYPANLIFKSLHVGLFSTKFKQSSNG